MDAIRTSWHRWALALGLLAAALFGVAQTARAFQSEDDGVIEANEVIDDDVFVEGQTVRVDGTVNGNLIASGGRVTVNGTVNGDAILSGQEVVVNGAVNGNLFAAGMTVTMNGQVDDSVMAAAYSLNLGPSFGVDRNALVAGYSLRAEPGSTVGRDVMMGGYQAVLGGEIGRDATVDLAALEIDGRVGGDVNASVGQPAQGAVDIPLYLFFGGSAVQSLQPGLRVSESADIGGRLVYTSPVEQAAAIRAAPAGGVSFELMPVEETGDGPEPPVTPLGALLRWIVGRLQELATLIVLGLLAAWQIPGLMKRLAEQVRARPLPSAGWGLLAVIVGYVGAAILAVLIVVFGILLAVVTLGGLANTVFGVGLSSLGLAFALFSLLVSYGSKLVVAFLLGKLVLRAIVPQAADHRLWPLLTGVLIYVLVASIPILGWLVAVVVTFVGLGAMWLTFREWRAPAPPTAAAAD